MPTSMHPRSFYVTLPHTFSIRPHHHRPPSTCTPTCTSHLRPPRPFPTPSDPQRQRARARPSLGSPLFKLLSPHCWAHPHNPDIAATRSNTACVTRDNAGWPPAGPLVTHPRIRRCAAPSAHPSFRKHRKRGPPLVPSADRAKRVRVALRCRARHPHGMRWTRHFRSPGRRRRRRRIAGPAALA